eukprot:CAMPEP_0185513704 /NCGR_PEP_ID=MMETSP1366-20130426/57379_1 /TAXON_ID=38817 /ORGANISM="Gephyrocapsa oceanica, Strain RCC1303" /LENGTH=35 /DNA_ID= /DNA_START= /DNA_END= /DNA_ORIENTATION=
MKRGAFDRGNHRSISAISRPHLGFTASVRHKQRAE